MFTEFTNNDATNPTNSCGQVAVATLLVSMGQIPALDAVKTIENDFPPDILHGIWGSSKWLIDKACTAYGVELQEMHGMEALIGTLAEGGMAILLLGWTEGWFPPKPYGHWTVAHAYDPVKDAISLANWGDEPVASVKKLWTATIPMLGGMYDRCLVPWHR